MATKPQDHKTKKTTQDEQKQTRFDELPGAELLKPFSELTGADAMRIVGKLSGVLGADLEDMDQENVSAIDVDFDAAADLVDYIGERYVVDPEGWGRFNTAKNMSNVLNLITAYAGELGKDED